MGYLVENYETKETRAEYFSRYYVDYTDRDVACEFSLSPLLIKNMNSTMYIGPYDSAEVINDDFYIPKNEALIKDLIIGIISPAVPTHLPTPAAEVSLEWKAGEYCIVCHDYHSGYMRIWSNATMDIVNEDGYLIDPDKVRAKFYVNGKYLYSQRVYPNDDQELVHMLVDTSFIKKDEWVKRPKVEVECVYTKDDGTTVVSPRVEAKIVSYKGPSGVTEIGDDVSFEDNTTYDLTGRPVNPENLAPGIYIRNGRKFAVGR